MSTPNPINPTEDHIIKDFSSRLSLLSQARKLVVAKYILTVFINEVVPFKSLLGGHLQGILNLAQNVIQLIIDGEQFDKVKDLQDQIKISVANANRIVAILGISSLGSGTNEVFTESIIQEIIKLKNIEKNLKSIKDVL